MVTKSKLLQLIQELGFNSLKFSKNNKWPELQQSWTEQQNLGNLKLCGIQLKFVKNENWDEHGSEILLPYDVNSIGLIGNLTISCIGWLCNNPTKP